MPPILHGKRVAFLVDDGFEQSELSVPKGVLDAAGADVHLVSPREYTVRAWRSDARNSDWGSRFAVTRPVRDALALGYDALVLPGGVMNTDGLRCDPHAIALIRSFMLLGKPLAAINHAPQLLIEADLVRGRRLTSIASIRTDLLNAGANWVDQAVVVDRNLITSRRPEDLEPFTTLLVDACLVSSAT